MAVHGQDTATLMRQREGKGYSRLLLGAADTASTPAGTEAASRHAGPMIAITSQTVSTVTPSRVAVGRCLA